MSDAEAHHLLVVDDDDRLRSLIKRYLSAAGYRVTLAQDAPTATRMMETMRFDLAILDIMMPEQSGLDLLTQMRAAANDLPVILLTARDLAADRIDGLKKGADDYLSKPFEPEELSLRIAGLLRRALPEKALDLSKVHMSGLVFDPERGELNSAKGRVRLTESETQLLALLAAHRGEPVARQTLAEKTSSGQERSVDVQVTRLRKKIEPDPREPMHLQTVRGVGYRLMVD